MTAFTKTATIFRLFKEAIRGDEQNFTEGNINRAIFLLSIPMILEMAMESLFAVVDIFFVSRLNSSDAVAAIGLTESMLTIVYSVAMGLSMGATAMVARRIGEKDEPGAAAAGIQSVYIGLAFAILIGGTGIVFYKSNNQLLSRGDCTHSATVDKQAGCFICIIRTEMLASTICKRIF